MLAFFVHGMLSSLSGALRGNEDLQSTNESHNANTYAIYMVQGNTQEITYVVQQCVLTKRTHNLLTALVPILLDRGQNALEPKFDP